MGKIFKAIEISYFVFATITIIAIITSFPDSYRVYVVTLLVGNLLFLGVKIWVFLRHKPKLQLQRGAVFLGPLLIPLVWDYFESPTQNLLSPTTFLLAGSILLVVLNFSIGWSYPWKRNNQ